ncbi:hypothetical protein A4A49_46411 [Nicotiana attenuata]|uniref:Uncharacterized protein n=1 Tax=Nicotiana attenuata TaxID=49451 RepID=A0A314KJT8_NICAT|nr:hypothetical protein A4A49_46411 [Nicotiana attenuata]
MHLKAKMHLPKVGFLGRSFPEDSESKNIASQRTDYSRLVFSSCLPEKWQQHKYKVLLDTDSQGTTHPVSSSFDYVDAGKDVTSQTFWCMKAN